MGLRLRPFFAQLLWLVAVLSPCLSADELDAPCLPQVAALLPSRASGAGEFDFLHIQWAKDRFQVFKNTLSSFHWNFPAQSPESPGLSSIDRLWRDSGRFSRWARGIFAEVLQDLRDQGVDVERPVSDKVLERALDSVLLSHAINQGFKIDVDRPFYIKSVESGASFKRRVKEGQFFYDFGGDLMSLPFAAFNRHIPYRHTMRGHAIQLLYAADNIPGFIEIYRNLEPHWGDYFDYATSHDLRTPATGVLLFRQLFGISK